MRTVYPYGIFVKKRGDTMTGTLTIRKDSTTPEIPHISLEGVTGAGTIYAIQFKDGYGIRRGYIYVYILGDLRLAGRRKVEIVHDAFGTKPPLRTWDITWDISPLRTMFLASLIMS